MLDPLANQLRGMGLTVFVPTLPGYDVSWPLLPRHAYSFRRLAECVQKQLAEQRITSYVVVGHDLGAAIGIQLAGDSRCHGVVSIALPHPAAFFAVVTPLDSSISCVVLCGGAEHVAI